MAASEKLTEIRQHCSNGLQIVNEALKADEQNETSKAIELYVKALNALQNGVIFCMNSNINTHEVLNMRLQMEGALTNVQERLYALNITNHKQQSDQATAPLPQYSENVPEGHTSLQTDNASDYSIESCLGNNNSVELLKIENGVQMYFVTSTDQVSTMPPSYPTSLYIFYTEDTIVESLPTSSAWEGQPTITLQVGEIGTGWSYELKPRESPVLRTSNGTYVFPCKDAENYVAVGIVFSDNVPQTCIDTFDSILDNLAVFEKISVQDDTMSGKIAYGIRKGAEYLGYGLAKGAEGTNYVIDQAKTEIQKNISPNNEPLKVSSNVEKGLHYTKQATEATVKVSKYLVEGLYTLTSKAGTYIAPYAKQAGEKIFPPSENGQTNGHIEATAKVLDAGLFAFGSVWNDLEKAGIAIATSVSDATVDTVQLKYGTEAGHATNQAMTSGLNIGRTAFNVNHLGIKAIMKRAAKDTGKAVVNEFVSDKEKKENTKAKETECKS